LNSKIISYKSNYQNSILPAFPQNAQAIIENLDSDNVLLFRNLP